MPGHAFVTTGGVPGLTIAPPAPLPPRIAAAAPAYPSPPIGTGFVPPVLVAAAEVVGIRTRQASISGRVGIAIGERQGPSGPPGPAGLTGIYNEPLTIETKNVIPPLSLPWKAAPGAFANIIVGAATLVSGQGAVTFVDGSRDVAFNPDASTGGAGFPLDPGDIVVAQYNIG